MNKTEFRRFISLMEFFYGFLFGVAIFAAALVFLISPDFFLGILFAISVFSFFLFLMALVRYCIMRSKLAQQAFEISLESRIFQEQILRTLRRNDNKNEDKQE
ncbi:hypothetical protein CQA53_07775 [Helicobacter didelphidarum]|uniref:Uncharacterized protein n=1 Tax=Helicobacter didelphidarum TaxID=2040648 RepID=A0A3D8IG45_9HELI|nr:hypothetical protein [Helicobacter didelphidarum]RDU64217.1 hypothetical protein CQA53_07775 [Helicobacter didelphidarum]